MSARPEQPGKHGFTGDMADVADICGTYIAQALVDNLPGIEVKIPKVWSPSNILARLDRKVADILIANFPGDVFYIPTGKGSADTRVKARSLRLAGKSNTEIALELGVTERHVRGLLNSELPAPRYVDSRQIDMFDVDGQPIKRRPRT
jgi:hypothetical protein